MQTGRRLMGGLAAICMASIAEHPYHIKAKPKIDEPEVTAIPRSDRDKGVFNRGHRGNAGSKHKANRLALSRKAKLKRRRSSSRG